MIYMEEELIEQVRDNPILYDLKHKGYRNQVLRKEAWDDIGERLGKSGEYCKETWNKLRNAYTNALNRRKSRQLTSRKMPKWTFEDQMAFLPLSAAYRPRQYERRSPRTSHEETQEQDQNNDNSNDEDVEIEVEPIVLKENDDIKPSLLQIANDTHSTTDHSDFAAHHFETTNFEEFVTPSRRETNSQNKKLEKTLNELVVIMKNHNQMLSQQFSSQNNKNCTSHDDDEMYFLSLAKFVKKLNPAERIRVKGEVSQFVFQAELRNLSNEEKNNQQNKEQQPQQEQEQRHQKQQPVQVIQKIPLTLENATSETFFSETVILNPKIEKE